MICPYISLGEPLLLSIIILETPKQMGKKTIKFVSISPILLKNCKFSSETNSHLASRHAGNKKSLRTVVYICKSIVEISGISNMLQY